MRRPSSYRSHSQGLVRAAAVVLCMLLPCLRGPSAGASPRVGAGPIPADVGLSLDGRGSTLVPPSGASSWPAPGSRGYDVNLNAKNCRQLLDAGFAGQCAVASGPNGSVTGIVEHLASNNYNLVWQRRGRRWWLVLRRSFSQQGQLGQVYSAPIGPGGAPQLVFVTAGAKAGFGQELDVVGEEGRIDLYRDLALGFAVSTADGDLVEYRSTSTEQGVPPGEYDQLLMRCTARGWTSLAQQFVPGPAALAQHHGLFWSARG